MADDQLTTLVTQGFAGINERLRERDKDAVGLSEKIVRMEGVLDGLTTAVGKLETELKSAEIVDLRSRVRALESSHLETKEKQKENAKWFKGLLASVIILLMGIVLNFIRITLK